MTVFSPTNYGLVENIHMMIDNDSMFSFGIYI